MLSEQQVQTFHEQGFLLGPRVLSDEQVDLLRGEIERVIANADRAGVPQPAMLRNMGDEERPVWQIVNIWQASEPFEQLMRDESVVGMIAQLMDEPRAVRMWHDQIQYKPAQKGGVNWWHQDSIYWPVMREKDRQVTAWVALDDVDADNGCMSMVAGSHRWGDQIAHLHRMRDELGLKNYLDLNVDHRGEPVALHTCPVRAGHVHFHHALTWHGSQANTSGRPRRAIALHYMSDPVSFDASGDHPLKRMIDAQDNEPIRGDAFPVVWSADQAVARA